MTPITKENAFNELALVMNFNIQDSESTQISEFDELKSALEKSPAIRGKDTNGCHFIALKVDLLNAKEEAITQVDLIFKWHQKFVPRGDILLISPFFIHANRKLDPIQDVKELLDDKTVTLPLRQAEESPKFVLGTEKIVVCSKNISWESPFFALGHWQITPLQDIKSLLDSKIITLPLRRPMMSHGNVLGQPLKVNKLRLALTPPRFTKKLVIDQQDIMSIFKNSTAEELSSLKQLEENYGTSECQILSFETLKNLPEVSEFGENPAIRGKDTNGCHFIALKVDLLNAKDEVITQGLFIKKI